MNSWPLRRVVCQRPDARCLWRMVTPPSSSAYRNERGVMMAAGSANLFVFATRQSNPPPIGRQLGLFGNAPGIDHISFAVADVDAVYSALRTAGVAFDSPPEDQAWGARMVGLKDPDGNNLYLLQKL